MKYGFVFTLFVIVGIVVGVLGLGFYALFAKDFKEYLRGAEMDKCIKIAQANSPDKLWTMTTEGRDCMTKFQDVWIKR